MAEKLHWTQTAEGRKRMSEVAKKSAATRKKNQSKAEVVVKKEVKKVVTPKTKQFDVNLFMEIIRKML
jgi:hypothetical protein